MNFLQKRKERGRVLLENIHYIEVTRISNQADEYPFQIGYQESGQDYILHLFASKEQERTDWILALRKGNKEFYTCLENKLIKMFITILIKIRSLA